MYSRSDLEKRTLDLARDRRVEQNVLKVARPGLEHFYSSFHICQFLHSIMLIKNDTEYIHK